MDTQLNPAILIVTQTESRAELLVIGVGGVYVEPSDRVLRPSTEACSLRIFEALHSPGLAWSLVSVLSDIEAAASSIFPEFEDGLCWVWCIHNCKRCSCHNCTN